MDTKCPFDYQLNVPKNKLNEHVEKECSKRPYTCQHCGFKGTYEEVMNVHLPECKFQHLHEELQAFREKQRKYVVELKGVAMSFQDQQKKLHEQERNLEDQKIKLQQNDQRQVDSKKILQNQATKLQDHERRIDEGKNELQEHKNLLLGQEKKQLEHEKKMQDIEKNIEGMEAKQQDRNKELRQELQEQMVSDKLKSQEEIQKMQDQLQKNNAKLTQTELSLGLMQRFVLVNFSLDRAKIIHNEMQIQTLSTALATRRSVEHWTRALTALGKVN